MLREILEQVWRGRRPERCLQIHLEYVGATGPGQARGAVPAHAVSRRLHRPFDLKPQLAQLCRRAVDELLYVQEFHASMLHGHA